MTIADLWLPIIVSAALAWIASALIWTVLPWHKNDYAKTGDEEGVRATLKGLRPGFYNVPHCNSQKELKQPEMQQKFTDGPIALINVLPNGLPPMGRNMGLIYGLLTGGVFGWLAYPAPL